MVLTQKRFLILIYSITFRAYPKMDRNIARSFLINLLVQE